MPELELLHTKLFIPPPRPVRVPRPHLIELLNKGLYRKMTLISAPAGFGKTTLVSEWIEGLKSASDKPHQDDYSIGWVSLDESENDPSLFLTYLVSALKQNEELATIEEAAMRMLQSPQPARSEPIEDG